MQSALLCGGMQHSTRFDYNISNNDDNEDSDFDEEHTDDDIHQHHNA